MNEKLLVSIVIPVYNAEQSLEACLDSVLRQEYENFEVILIDDGSTDRTGEIGTSYRDKSGGRIHYIFQENSGPATARNRGIEECKGEYIAFVDADDTIAPNMIGKMLTAAVANDADMVICSYRIIDDGNVSNCPYTIAEGLYQGKGAEDILYSVLTEADGGIPPYSWVRLTRRSVITDNGMRFQNGLVRSEDYHFWTKVHTKTEKVYVLDSEPLYDYIFNSQSITHRYVKKYWDGVQFIYDDLQKNIPESDRKKEMLDMMLVKRSLISLNNATRCKSVVQAWRDICGIVFDKRLNSVIRELAGTEAKGYTSYRRMMCKRRNLLVAFKYMFENLSVRFGTGKRGAIRRGEANENR